MRNAASRRRGVAFREETTSHPAGALKLASALSTTSGLPKACQALEGGAQSLRTSAHRRDKTADYH